MNKLLKFSEKMYAFFACLGGGTLPFSIEIGAPMLQRTGRVGRRPAALGQKFLRMEGPMTSLKTIAEKLNAWRRYREAVRELSQLSDRELEDIGIRRGDIHFVARGALAQ